jgi:hypothetical protein
MELTDDSTQEGFDFPRGYPVLPHHFTLRTQNTSWGRLCAALFCVELITTPAKITNIGDSGSSTEFVCFPGTAFPTPDLPAEKAIGIGML